MLPACYESKVDAVVYLLVVVSRADVHCAKTESKTS